jgi:hypothetical protein
LPESFDARPELTMQQARRRKVYSTGRGEGTRLTSFTGPLSVIGDPVGQVADKALKPVGHLTGQVGQPAGEALSNVENEAIEQKGGKDNPNKPDHEKPGGERIGGKQQTASNPLGL